MLLSDVNVYVNAFRTDSHAHVATRAWLEKVVYGDEAFAVSEEVMCSFLRLVTNPRIYRTPTPLASALEFAELIMRRPNCLVARPGERFWPIFSRLCTEVDARAKLIPDAYLAALAIEHGCEFVTYDRDFARFPGLRWRPPVD